MERVNYTTKTPILLQNEEIGPGGGGDDDGDEDVEIGHRSAWVNINGSWARDLAVYRLASVAGETQPQGPSDPGSRALASNI